MIHIRHIVNNTVDETRHPCYVLIVNYACDAVYKFTSRYITESVLIRFAIHQNIDYSMYTMYLVKAPTVNIHVVGLFTYLTIDKYD